MFNRVLVNASIKRALNAKIWLNLKQMPVVLCSLYIKKVQYSTFLYRPVFAVVMRKVMFDVKAFSIS